jgi:hypothetical protein
MSIHGGKARGLRDVPLFREIFQRRRNEPICAGSVHGMYKCVFHSRNSKTRRNSGGKKERKREKKSNGRKKGKAGKHFPEFK